MNFLQIVFDGPPGPEAGRFVEVEDSTGRSIRLGEWVKREDGLWALRITAVDVLQCVEAASIERQIREEEEREERINNGPFGVGA